MNLRFTQIILVCLCNTIHIVSLFQPHYCTDIEKDSSSGMEQTLEQVKKLIGEPRNYGPTPEEKAEMDRRAMEKKVSIIIIVHHLWKIFVRSDKSLVFQIVWL